MIRPDLYNYQGEQVVTGETTNPVQRIQGIPQSAPATHARNRRAGGTFRAIPRPLFRTECGLNEREYAKRECENVYGYDSIEERKKAII